MSESGNNLSVELARIDTYRLRRSSRDLYARALIGPIFYVVAWVLLLVVSDAVRALGGVVLVPLVVFALFGWARFRHRTPGEDANAEELERWARSHWRIVTLGSACWGAVPALVGWLERKPESPILIAALSTMAFGTASSQAFAMRASQARLTMFLLMAPGVATFLAIDELRSTGVTLFFYALYLVANLRRSSAEYEHQVDTELELLRSREEVALLSLTDELTGLPNRRNYEVVWPQASSAALRQQQPLALLVVDLDHFKAVNDLHGHLGGDACLRHFAGLLRQQFQRESDFLARIGGEEFIVILPGATAEAACVSAEQLRVLVEKTPFQFGGANIALTVSVGVAALDDPGLTFEHADGACYAAKKAGRNRVQLWSPLVQTGAR
ncbi:MAG: GGDEF domain-containing protein [Archangium sp.]|nr:GGDEF domain-containing protein [Archangium sp.]